MPQHPSSRCASRPLPALLALSLLGATGTAKGTGWEAELHGTATFGTMIRVGSPDPDNYGNLSAARLGLPPGRLGANSGGSDLNFSANRPVSTVVKAVADLTLKRADHGLFARARGWYDQELSRGNRPYGNYPNGFSSGIPLSDEGFARAARFSGLELAEVYGFQHLRGDDWQADIRLGRQVQRWGVASWLGTGVNQLNAFDLAAFARPGNLNDREGRVPLGMLSVELHAGERWTLRGALPYEFRPQVLPGCGTFFSALGALASGCNFSSVLASQDEPTALANGLYVHRLNDQPTSHRRELALQLSHRPLPTLELSAYWLHLTSRAGTIQVRNADLGPGFGTLTSRLSDPAGVAYQLIYPEALRTTGVSLDYRPQPGQRWYAELGHRANQPLMLNASDLIAAFIGRQPGGALNLARGVNTLPPGAFYDGFDRFPVTALTLGGQWAIPPATALPWPLLLSAEVGVSRVQGLPDPGRLRYGRSDEYGIARIDGGAACSETTPAQRSCARQGFITAQAWGYRLQLNSRLPRPWLGARWQPSLHFAHDVRGYAADGLFFAGRKTLRPGLRAEWKEGRQDYFAEAQLTRQFASPYYPLSDRSYLTLVAGLNF